MDVRLDKTVELGRTRLIASVDCFNAFNEAIVLNRVQQQNGANANNVITVLAPQIFRLGAPVLVLT